MLSLEELELFTELEASNFLCGNVVVLVGGKDVEQPEWAHKVKLSDCGDWTCKVSILPEATKQAFKEQKCSLPRL